MIAVAKIRVMLGDTTTERYRDEALALGAAAFLVKPLQLGEFLAALRLALELA